MSKQSDHERWNEEMAQRYNPDAFITQSGFPIRMIEAMRLSCALKLLECRETDSILDLGCGPGNLLETLHGKQIVGLDLSDTLLAQARNRVQGRRNIQVIKGDAEALPFSDLYFDRIVCSEVLEHVLDPIRVLEEIHRVAKTGARIVITLPNEGLINWTKKIVLATGLRNAISGGYEMSDNMLDEWHRTEISPTWLKKACSSRFKKIRHVHVPFFLLPYHTIVVLEVV